MSQTISTEITIHEVKDMNGDIYDFTATTDIDGDICISLDYAWASESAPETFVLEYLSADLSLQGVIDHACDKGFLQAAELVLERLKKDFPEKYAEMIQTSSNAATLAQISSLREQLDAIEKSLK